MAISIAEDYHISTTTFTNLIESESKFRPDATSTQGDRGIMQVNSKAHPEVSDTCAFDPNCAMQWAAGRIVDGYLSEWTSANCYAYVSLFVKLPLMQYIKPDTTPSKGSVAIFDYHGIEHLAYVTGFSSEGFTVKEANYHPALVDTREVKWTDPALRGFWKPLENPTPEPLATARGKP